MNTTPSTTAAAAAPAMTTTSRALLKEHSMTLGYLLLFVALSFTVENFFSSANIVGLLLSSLAKSSDWVMPMLVVMIMSAIVFAGGLIPVTGRAGR